VTAPTSIRLDSTLVEQLDQLATATDRPRSWHIERAVVRYLEEEAWQVKAIQEALDDYRSGTADLVSHEEVKRRIEERRRARRP
jgi:predicted transcriptional regulator